MSAVELSWREVVRRLWSVRRLLTVVGLTLAWCALWGSISVANVASGLAVSFVALLLGVGGSGRGGVRIVPLLQFTWLVAVDLVGSTITVVREVLTPTDHTEEGIIAIPLPPGSSDHLLLLFVAITVTPGTAVVAADPERSILYLHVLHCDRRRFVVEHVHELADLAVRALPHPDEGDPVRSGARDGSADEGVER